METASRGIQVPEPLDEEPAIEDEAGLIQEYDPLAAPDPAEWLSLGEQERIDLIMDYHRRAGIRVPNAALHAAMHGIVENQIAEGDELPALRTAQRLIAEGLDRHDAIHAIGTELAAHINNLAREVRLGLKPDKRDVDRDPNDAYFAELERLTAEQWLRS